MIVESFAQEATFVQDQWRIRTAEKLLRSEQNEELGPLHVHFHDVYTRNAALLQRLVQCHNWHSFDIHDLRIPVRWTAHCIEPILA